jgi:hypothetical protein
MWCGSAGAGNQFGRVIAVIGYPAVRTRWRTRGDQAERNNVLRLIFDTNTVDTERSAT